MPRIRIDLGYDGGDFCGWQLQASEASVQGALEEALAGLTGETVRVIGSGRTDSGVHAVLQTAHFDTETTIPPEKFAPALNSRLPRGVRVIRSRLVDESFHARFSARRREYQYRILPASLPTPFSRGRTLCLRRRPDLGLLNRLTVPILGEHDFTTFAAAGDASDSKIRRIFAASFLPRRGEILFHICGTAFLWRMVRSLIGTLLELEERRQGPEAMRALLDARDRSQAGATAPPEGLYLYRVYYQEAAKDG